MNCLPLIPIYRNPAADQPVLVTRLIVLGALYTSLGLVLPFRFLHGLFLYYSGSCLHGISLTSSKFSQSQIISFLEM